MTETTTRERKRHRRGNGEGSVFQRKDGLWAGTITVGYSETGKRIRRTVYAPTKKEVLDKLRGLSNENAAGILAEPNNMLAADYFRDWLKNSAKPVLRATTHANYKNSLERQVIPFIGGLKLKHITAAHLQGLYAALQDKKLSPRTIRTAHIVIRRALTQAVRWRFIPRDVSLDVRPPAIQHREMSVLTAEQCREFLKTAATDRMYALYLVALTTGMRLAELCGLQWQDLDFDRCRISVARTATYVSGELTVDAPKTKRSRRTIDVSAGVIEALNEHRKAMLREGLGGCPWVFPSRQGNPQSRSNLHAYSFKRILKAAGLPDIRFHDLRHTAASLMLEQGVNAKVVQERLGHSSIAITLDVYSHIMPGMQAEAASRMDAVLTGKIGCSVATKQA